MDRIEKVNQLIKREISLLLQQELQDSRLKLVTILAVKTSRDLSHARVSFSVLGESQVEEVQRSLENARGYIRRMLAQRVRIRHMPDIEFFYDKSIEYSDRINKALQEINEELSPRKENES